MCSVSHDIGCSQQEAGVRCEVTRMGAKRSENCEMPQASSACPNAASLFRLLIIFITPMVFKKYSQFTVYSVKFPSNSFNS